MRAVVFDQVQGTPEVREVPTPTAPPGGAEQERTLRLVGSPADLYTLTCTWDEKTEKLATRVTGPDYEEATMLDLTALIRFHSE